MNPLSELQGRFSANLLSTEANSDYIRSDGLSAASRLDIYRNNVFSNYRQALRAVYPVVEKLVGAEFFEHAADHYIRAYPSSSGDLNQYGSAFAQFLAGFAPVQSLPYLHDVAELEWLVEQVFHAADHAPFDLARLQAIPIKDYAGLKFQLHPACRLYASSFPVALIWRVNQADWKGNTNVDLGQGGQTLLVHRQEFAIVLRPLAAGEFAMLQQLANGSSFTSAYEAAQLAQADFDLNDFLQQHIVLSTLVDMEVPITSHKIYRNLMFL